MEWDWGLEMQFVNNEKENPNFFTKKKKMKSQLMVAAQFNSSFHQTLPESTIQEKIKNVFRERESMWASYDLWK